MKKKLKSNKVITDPKGQYNHPGEVTRIPSNSITMKNIPYPVLGIDNLGNQQLMQPEIDYVFPGEYVTEYPNPLQYGGIIPAEGYAPVGQYPAGHNPNGKYSEEQTFGLQTDQGTFVLPLTWNGKVHTQDEAAKRFMKEKDHMGFFPDTKSAERGSNLRNFINKEILPYEKRGGQIPGVTLKSGLRRGKTDKNIQSSINKLMLRNPDIFGPSGRRIYEPKQLGGQMKTPPTEEQFFDFGIPVPVFHGLMEKGGESDKFCPGYSPDDFLGKRQNTLLKFVRGNTQKALHEEAVTDTLKMFMGVPDTQDMGYAQQGGQTKTLEDRIDDYLGNPMQTSSQISDVNNEDDPIDNLRHATAGMMTSSAIKDKIRPFQPPIDNMASAITRNLAGFLGSNILGIGHEIFAPNLDTEDPDIKKFTGSTIREGAEDIFNNFVGSTISSLPFSREGKVEALEKLSFNNLLPDGYGKVNNRKGNMYFSKEMPTQRLIAGDSQFEFQQGGPVAQQRGQCPQGQYWNGTTCVPVQGYDQWAGYQAPNQNMDINNVYRNPTTIDQSLKPVPPLMAGDESIPGASPQIPNDVLRQMISSNTWQGGLPGEEFMTNSQYSMGEMMEVEKSQDPKSSPGKDTKTPTNAGFDGVALASTIIGGLNMFSQNLELSQQNKQKKKDSYKLNPNYWSALAKPNNRGDYSDGFRFSGNNFRPNEYNWGQYSKFGGPVEYAVDQEVDMEESELLEFLRLGGKVEYC